MELSEGALLDTTAVTGERGEYWGVMMTMLGTMLVLRLTVLGTGWATDTVTRDSPEHWKVEPCLAARDSGLESEFQEWRAKPEYEGEEQKDEWTGVQGAESQVNV